MPAFRLVLEYDGTDFEGWQQQPAGHRTVQSVLVSALQQISSGPVRVRGAGRTDAGVHALGQVAAVELETRMDAEPLLRALNANLPRDVAVRAAASVAPDFDPRREARSKCYRYSIWNGPERSPLRARFCHQVDQRLDLAALEQAAQALEGRHDFASFQAAGSGVTATVRTLFRVAVLGATEADLWLEFEGDGFLRHMVRNLVGTLLEVATGRRAADSMGELLAARDRREAGATAPARGLALVWVRYEPAPGGRVS